MFFYCFFFGATKFFSRATKNLKLRILVAPSGHQTKKLVSSHELGIRILCNGRKYMYCKSGNFRGVEIFSHFAQPETSAKIKAREYFCVPYAPVRDVMIPRN